MSDDPKISLRLVEANVVPERSHVSPIEAAARSFPSGGPIMKDFEAFVPDLARMTHGSRVLVIGGAGTIGSASLRALLSGRAKAISVVDTNENGLAELTRDIRNREWAAPLPELEFVPLDYGSPIMERYLDDRDFDFVLNFAALKHVRSEKNAWSSLQLLHVNVLSLMALIRALDRGGLGPSRIFSVSTDKAADPANLMGASKRIMEAVLLERSLGAPDATRTSVRFANVAFSAGSLLESWTLRMLRQQPLACPADTRRFFISSDESGMLCTLAAFGLRDQTVGVPSSEAGVRELGLEAVVRSFLAEQGLEALVVESEQEARRIAAAPPRGRYPLLLTPRDTIGEKQAEQFVGANETQAPSPMRSLDTVVPSPIDMKCLERLERELLDMERGEVTASKEAVVASISAVVESLQHIDSRRGLDERM